MTDNSNHVVSVAGVPFGVSAPTKEAAQAWINNQVQQDPTLLAKRVKKLQASGALSDTDAASLLQGQRIPDFVSEDQNKFLVGAGRGFENLSIGTQQILNLAIKGISDPEGGFAARASSRLGNLAQREADARERFAVIDEGFGLEDLGEIAPELLLFMGSGGGAAGAKALKAAGGILRSGRLGAAPAAARSLGRAVGRAAGARSVPSIGMAGLAQGLEAGAIGALSGGLRGTVEGESRLTNAAIGGALGAAGPLASRGLQAAARSVSKAPKAFIGALADAGLLGSATVLGPGAVMAIAMKNVAAAVGGAARANFRGGALIFGGKARRAANEKLVKLGSEAGTWVSDVVRLLDRNGQKNMANDVIRALVKMKPTVGADGTKFVDIQDFLGTLSEFSDETIRASLPNFPKPLGNMLAGYRKVLEKKVGGLVQAEQTAMSELVERMSTVKNVGEILQAIGKSSNEASTNKLINFLWTQAGITPAVVQQLDARPSPERPEQVNLGQLRQRVGQ